MTQGIHRTGATALLMTAVCPMYSYKDKDPRSAGLYYPTFEQNFTPTAKLQNPFHRLNRL